MDSGAARRRSTRVAARSASIRIHAASSEGSIDPIIEPLRTRRRKRQEPFSRPHVKPTVDEDLLGAAAAVPPEGSNGTKRGTRKKKAAAAAGPSREYEKELWQQGFAHVAGVDEAGRGPLAGPVVAAACIIPPHVVIVGIDDSKKLNEQQRENIYALLTNHPEVRWATQVIESDEIDAINILQAALKAMEGAAAGLVAYDYLLVDGNRLPKGVDPERSQTIVKGDSECYTIAAASIIAKVTRDRLMEGYHSQYPQYNFQQHKGYGVPAHVEAIRKHGPCPIHRRTFAPVKHWYPKDKAKREAR